MLPVVALLGRPNVGKSTLFNRITRSREALVADFPGLTRDRKYGEARVGDRAFVVIDTGGITGDESGIDAAMARQSLAAASEADALLLLVDAREGLHPVDEWLVGELRRGGRHFHLVVNKIDGLDEDTALAEFHALGLDDVHAIAASQGRGIRALVEAIVLPAGETSLSSADPDRPGGIRVAVVGRPNVGKSTLVNRMLGEERVVVYDQPGTTRDSIYIDYERDGVAYTLIDTAGIRRRKNVRETVEKFSIVKTLKAIEDAHVVLLLFDGTEGIVEQDLHLLGHCLERGRGLVLAVNKWDGLDPEQRQRVHRELERRLHFIDYAEQHFISALHGTGVGHLYEAVGRAHASATQPLATPRLTAILEGAVADHPPPMVNGRRIKLRYAHAGGRNPPLVIVHGNQVGKVPASYQRYLEKVFSRSLDLVGTPLQVEFRGGENPFAGRRNTLTRRQLQRKRRLMSHVRKRKKGR